MNWAVTMSASALQRRSFHKPRELGADAFDLVAVRVEFGVGRAALFEQRPHEHEPLQTQDEIVELALEERTAHAAASSSTTPASPNSGSACAGRDSSINAASSPPSAATAAST
jgi:hypothetical protein